LSTTTQSATPLPNLVPVFPLAGALLLPRAVLPLNIFEPRYLAMVDFALGHDRVIAILQPAIDADGTADEGRTPALSPIGTLGRITHFTEEAEKRYLIALTGLTRFEVVEEAATLTPFRQVRINTDVFAADLDPGRGENDVDRPAFLGVLRDYAEFASFEIDWDNIEKMGLEDLVNACVMASPYGPRERQALLEAGNLRQRAEMLTALAEMEMNRHRSATSVQ